MLIGGRFEGATAYASDAARSVAVLTFYPQGTQRPLTKGVANRPRRSPPPTPSGPRTGTLLILIHPEKRWVRLGVVNAGWAGGAGWALLHITGLALICIGSVCPHPSPPANPLKSHHPRQTARDAAHGEGVALHCTWHILSPQEGCSHRLPGLDEPPQPPSPPPRAAPRSPAAGGAVRAVRAVCTAALPHAETAALAAPGGGASRSAASARLARPSRFDLHPRRSRIAARRLHPRVRFDEEFGSGAGEAGGGSCSRLGRLVALPPLVGGEISNPS